jgi:hypothetical protein
MFNFFFHILHESVFSTSKMSVHAGIVIGGLPQSTSTDWKCIKSQNQLHDEAKKRNGEKEKISNMKCRCVNSDYAALFFRAEVEPRLWGQDVDGYSMAKELVCTGSNKFFFLQEQF